MKRWSPKDADDIESPLVDAFLADIVAVCRKHGLSISHEDGNGAFVIEKFDEQLAQWLADAITNVG